MIDCNVRTNFVFRNFPGLPTDQFSTGSYTILSLTPCGGRPFHFFLFFCLITSKFIYFQHEARCSEQMPALFLNHIYLMQFASHLYPCACLPVLEPPTSHLVCLSSRVMLFYIACSCQKFETGRNSQFSKKLNKLSHFHTSHSLSTV